MLQIVASYRCMQLQGKLMSQTWENDKKPSFGTNFGLFGPNLGHKNFFMNFTYTTSKILLQAIIACIFKEN